MASIVDVIPARTSDRDEPEMVMEMFMQSPD
jgi:hypothetical protein